MTSDLIGVLSLGSVGLYVAIHLSWLAIGLIQRPDRRAERWTLVFIAAKTLLWLVLGVDQIRAVDEHGLAATLPLRYVVVLVGTDLAGMKMLYELDRRYRRGRDG